MTKEELQEKLKLHSLWLENKEGGVKLILDASADLRSADLRYANLRSADLRSTGILTFMFERDTAYYCGDSKIRIGCEYHDIDYWLINYEEIGRKTNYETRQIIAYKYFIDLCASMYIEEKK